MELTLKQKTAFGIGAVGKDMVYALSASYVMYYYQDVLGLSASFVGVVLMAARFFDAFNDPFMGVLVAKTRTRWGRFRPWIFSGTLLNALVLYALFAAPVLDEAALMVYFSVVYILWGVTYTMMDIPYWSMIPAVTRTPKDRENLSMVGRTCAGVGSALIAMFTMLLVGALGGDSERAGFRWVALIVAVIFAVTELMCCISMKETTPSEMKTATVKEMFSALFRNDQAMVVSVRGSFPARCSMRWCSTPVRRPGAGRSSADGLPQRGVHPVGRHLYHDGYPVLVHDPGRDPHQKDRENLSMVGRTCAGVGSALLLPCSPCCWFGGDSERAGFRWVALIVAVIFAMTELMCCISMKENHTVR